MAKKEKVQTEESTEPKRGRKVFVTDSKGVESPRADVIRELYTNQGKTRSEIVKILAEEYGHVVKYQIVFAATKPAKGDKAEDVKEAA